MKTAVSVPDPVFQAGERFAQRRGISRSHLYAKALLEYLQRHDEDEITRRLDKVYAEESSEPDPLITRIAAQSLPKESWK
jgi:metal-responsive CopG/Arc/MetJ family transcriptional regulator